VSHSECSISRYYQPLILCRLWCGFMFFRFKLLRPVPNHRLGPLLSCAGHNLANATTIGVRLIEAQPRKCRNQCDHLTSTHHGLHDIFGYWRNIQTCYCLKRAKSPTLMCKLSNQAPSICVGDPSASIRRSRQHSITTVYERYRKDNILRYWVGSGVLE
jgi:hypothetical protein